MVNTSVNIDKNLYWVFFSLKNLKKILINEYGIRRKTVNMRNIAYLENAFELLTRGFKDKQYKPYILTYIFAYHTDTLHF